ncbi:ABC transporter ATP-binding protein [Citricoccus sp. SGAir0253]|uniref:ABC transporter ATP-binding protein n=1 Tax=Citricoccus sp. SGAir0253 TaxID=2567881 RepID=UPI0010CCDFB9|nr:ABC transporter ATP-binding protein [Citricoccus sp. SGAir0253]QCU77010.1 ABC transporter ATP-binding protein [Citricoccus sp. SGAir0253]
MIRFDDVEVRYGDTVAIPRLDLEVREGEFFTLLGPSGCGKTTALRTLAGFVHPSAGRVFVDGRDVTRLPSDKREVGMVFQNYALFPSMSVRENIAFGLKVRRESRAERERLVADIARRVDLAEAHLDRNVAELSGGQQQRVAIARALVLQPKILLLDEPLSNLDAKLRQQLRHQLKELQAEVGITTVYVTHDQDEALTMSDRIAVFNAGRVEQVGTPQEVYDRSATEFVCTFLGDASRLTPALLTALDARHPGLDPRRTAYARLEKVALVAPGSSAPAGTCTVEGVVSSASYHGLHTTYAVESHGALVRVLFREDGRPRPAVGERVTLAVDPSHVLQYGDDDSASDAVPDPATVAAPAVGA